MTNFESTSYHVEDKAGESVAFTVLPPTGEQETAGTSEHDPVLRLWSTQVMPDNRLINVEVGFSVGDVAGLQSFLNDQFGRGKATASSPTPQTQRDNQNAEYFKSGWMSALKEVVLLARNERNPIDWAVAQLEGQVVGDEAPMSAPALGSLDYYEPVPMPDLQPGDPVTVHVGDETSHWTVGENTSTLKPAETTECRRTDPHHHMQDSTGIHWVHDGLEAHCPSPDYHHPVSVVHPLGLIESASRQCPVISNGVQCSKADWHVNSLLGGETAQHTFPQTGDGAAPPPATPSATPVPAGGEQAAESATGVHNTEVAPSSAPAEKKRTRRTKLEMAYDRALEALQSVPQGGEQWSAAMAAMNEAKAALAAKDPGNERLNQTVSTPGAASPNPDPVQIVPNPQPPVQFAGEPVNPFTQPPPTQQMPAAFVAPGMTNDHYLPEGPVQVSPAESQAAQGFPCPQMDSSGTRQCVRPYGHELMTATNPEPKPHVFATDPGALGGPLQPVQQIPQADPVEAFIPMPAKPQQPAFSVTTPALTGMTDGGAQILSFQTPPMPVDPTAFQVQGANLQPPAPAAPFLQPVPNGGQ